MSLTMRYLLYICLSLVGYSESLLLGKGIQGAYDLIEVGSAVTVTDRKVSSRQATKFFDSRESATEILYKEGTEYTQHERYGSTWEMHIETLGTSWNSTRLFCD